MVTNGLSDEFCEHVDGAFDGSLTANFLVLLNEKVVAWALFKKAAPIELDDFIYHTQQPIYQAQWTGEVEASERNLHKLKIYNVSPEEREIKMLE